MTSTIKSLPFWLRPICDTDQEEEDLQMLIAFLKLVGEEKTGSKKIQALIKRAGGSEEDFKATQAAVKRINEENEDLRAFQSMINKVDDPEEKLNPLRTFIQRVGGDERDFKALQMFMNRIKKAGEDSKVMQALVKRLDEGEEDLEVLQALINSVNAADENLRSLESLVSQMDDKARELKVLQTLISRIGKVNEPLKTLQTFLTQAGEEDEDDLQTLINKVKQKDTPTVECIVKKDENDTDATEMDHFQDIEDHKSYKPVDSSIGRIRHIALSIYTKQHNDDPNQEAKANTYNKIYTDLIIKLYKAFKNKDFIPIKGTLEQNTSSELKADLNRNQLHISVISPKEFRDHVARVMQAIKMLTRLTEQDIYSGDLGFGIASSEGKGLDVWIQDTFLAFQHMDINEFQSRLYKRFSKRRAAIDHSSALSKCNQFLKMAEQTKLSFDGGNVLFVGKYALIGKDNLLQKLGRKTELIPTEEYIEKFHQLTGIERQNILIIQNNIPRELFSKGWNLEKFNSLGKLQPLYHLDLFITPAGKDDLGRYRLLIGDPVFLGAQSIPYFRWVKENIDEIAKTLEKNYQDIVIYRNPMPMTYVDRFKKDKNGKDKLKDRIWFFASYNNCIVQYTDNPEDRFVWMPKYGSDFSADHSGYTYKNKPVYGGDWSELKEYDRANQEIWRSMGFKVIRLTNYLPLAIDRGAVHCITKVLYRAPEIEEN